MASAAKLDQQGVDKDVLAISPRVNSQASCWLCMLAREPTAVAYLNGDADIWRFSLVEHLSILFDCFISPVPHSVHNGPYLKQAAH